MKENIYTKKISELTQEDWLVLQVKTLFAHPLMSPLILMKSFGISQDLAAELLSFNLVNNILNMEE